MNRCAMKKFSLHIVAGALAITTLGFLGGCAASDSSYGVSYRSADYYDGPYYHRHSYHPYYERYYGPRGSFSFSYRD